MHGVWHHSEKCDHENVAAVDHSSLVSDDEGLEPENGIAIAAVSGEESRIDLSPVKVSFQSQVEDARPLSMFGSWMKT